MEISTFELLLKPIAPPPSSPLVSRRVVQGYFLTISNLEQKDLFFRIEFLVSLPDNPASPDAPFRLPDGNTLLAFDVAGQNVFLPLFRVGPPSNRYFGIFRLPAGKTASVELLPNILNPRLIANPQLEIRGYVRLSLPPVFVPEPPFFVPQSKEPVKVLLNAEGRGTFLPNSFVPPNSVNPGDLDFDQINYSLALASGQALNKVEPELFTPLSIPGNLDVLREAIKSKQFDIAKLRDLDNGRMLIAVLDQLELNKQDLATLTDLVPDSNISIKISNGNLTGNSMISTAQ